MSNRILHDCLVFQWLENFVICLKIEPLAQCLCLLIVFILNSSSSHFVQTYIQYIHCIYWMIFLLLFFFFFFISFNFFGLLQRNFIQFYVVSSYYSVSIYTHPYSIVHITMVLSWFFGRKFINRNSKGCHSVSSFDAKLLDNASCHINIISIKNFIVGQKYHLKC